jgi:hypothetical protein
MRRRIDIRPNEREEKGEQISQNKLQYVGSFQIGRY